MERGEFIQHPFLKQVSKMIHSYVPDWKATIEGVVTNGIGYVDGERRINPRYRKIQSEWRDHLQDLDNNVESAAIRMQSGRTDKDALLIMMLATVSILRADYSVNNP